MQNLYNNAKKLSTLVKIDKPQDLLNYNVELNHNNCEKSCEDKSEDEGLKDSDTPREAVFISPLYSVASRSSLEILVRYLETEKEFEKQLCGKKAKETEFSEIKEQKPHNLENVDYCQNCVFGVPLLQIRKYTVETVAVDYYQQDLPIIVHDCVERLLQGVLMNNLYYFPKDFRRVEQLVEEYNTGPEFRRQRNLLKEPFGNVTSLLTSYLKALPHSILGDAIFEAVLKWCVLPTIHSGLLLPMGFQALQVDPMETE